MSIYTVRFALLCVGILLGCFFYGGGSVILAASPKKEVRQPKADSSHPVLSRTEGQPKSGKFRKKDSNQGASPKVHRNNPTDAPAQYGGRRKARKMQPKATIQPRQDLSYHGMLEYPQRYDPSLKHRKGGPRNPQTSEVLHEHFQELDKNRDGMLDPFERALGRLDMDRDLGNRHWE